MNYQSLPHIEINQDQMKGFKNANNEEIIQHLAEDCEQSKKKKKKKKKEKMKWKKLTKM